MGRMHKHDGTAARALPGLMALTSLAALVTIISSLAGCTKPLFPDNAYRTQYDQYDRLRGDFVDPHQTDAYGKAVPSLRERLSHQ